MPKLVVLSPGVTTRVYELKADKTSVGRVEDNAFQIPEASVSSHHCEIILRGSEVVVNDLNSTNGTFINGNQLSGEGVLKPGQTLKLGQIEMRLEDGSASSAPAPVQASATAPAAAIFPVTPKRMMDHTSPIPTGVSLGDLEKGPMSAGFDTASKAFSKKKNKGNRVFIIVVGIIVAVLAGGIVYIALSLNGHK
jgi:pSer/pThr/pTyr-binding forkhead associated (FHA) protein